MKKQRRRRIFASIGLAAGVGLLYFELAHRQDSASGEFSFWIIVAGLLIVFALVELSSKPPDPL
jgi:hypothetical protein